MSLRTLSILFFNLGGEMLYILNQRLRAQNILPEKATKVLRDIVGQMFNERCIKELFRPQKVFKRNSLKTIFERLAHASIMKLNHSAMDKLYDLMVMAVKYQLLLCKRGEDVILVTLNHLDATRQLVGDSDEYITMINVACKTFTDHYSRLTPAQFIQLRNTLLGVFQDTHKRVSIFLKNKAQLSNGYFVISLGGPVPHGFEVPGAIRYYDNESCVEEERFTPLQQYEPPEPEGSWEITGNRVTTLGCNMYVLEKSVESSEKPHQLGGQGKGKKEQPQEQEKLQPPSDADPLVKAELDLLERLLLGIQPQSTGGAFKLKLFSDFEEEEGGMKPSARVLRIEPSKKGSAELSKIMQDFTIQETSTGQSNGDDLLDLMDQVA